ncbi:MAG: ABC transporter ATP-binding protein [Anaerolineae bacterium]
MVASSGAPVQPGTDGGGGARPVVPGAGRAFGGRPVEKPRDAHTATARLLGYLRPERGRVAGVAALSVMHAAFELAGPFLIGLAIDRAMRTADPANLTRLSLMLLAAYLLSWLSGLGQSTVMVSVAQRVLRALRRDLFEHLQTLSLAFYDRRPTGEVMSRLTNDIDAVNRVLSQSIIELASSVLTLVGIMVVMVAINPLLALGAFAILPLMVYLTARLGGGTRHRFQKVQVSLGQLNAVMEENVSGARVVQAFGRQGETVAAFDRANLSARDAGIQAQSSIVILRPLLMVLSNLDVVVIVGLGAWLTIRGQATVGAIASFVLYGRRFFDPLFTLADLYNSVQSALAGAERVFEILDERPQVRDVATVAETAPIRGSVTFEDVSFHYVPDVPVLCDVSLHAEPGQTIALVGPTGAGKTTIVNLLSRFYDVSAGRILIDGRDVREYAQAALRRQLGIVLQDTFLFSANVLENIRYGRLDATDEACIAAAQLANADQFIQRLPEGYHTPLSERAGNLSQGQRQLLAIARAILADPRVLILDEATSSVDSRTEADLQAGLHRLMAGRTSFVIAHRLSTIRNADEVLVVNDGRIIERGTHSDLLAMEGFYHRMYWSQFAGSEADA